MRMPFCMATIVALMVLGCTRMPDEMTLEYVDFGTGPEKDAVPCKVSFTNSFLESNDRAWVIVHTPDGSAVDTVVSVSGDTVVDLSGVDYDRVTFTIVFGYYYDSEYEAEIMTVYDAPRVHWLFEGEGESQFIGRKTFRLTYPSGMYTDVDVDGYGFSTSTTHWEPTSSSLLSTDYVRAYGGLYSLSATAVNDSTGSGYCAFVLNAPVPTADTIDINLTIAMTGCDISTNRPTDVVHLGLCPTSNRQSTVFISADWPTTALTTHRLSVPVALPASSYEYRLYLRGSGGDETTSFNYIRYLTAVPSSIDIPDGTISATVSSVTGVIENISVTGPVDVIQAEVRTQVCDWVLIAPPTVSTVRVPQMPDMLRDFLGETYLDSMETGDIDAIDYGAYADYDAAIEGVLSNFNAEADKFVRSRYLN